MFQPSRPFRATRRILSRILTGLSILVLAGCLAELALAGARLLRAERPSPGAPGLAPENFWSVWWEMQEQARAMGLR